MKPSRLTSQSQSAPVAKKCHESTITAPLPMASTAADASPMVRKTVNGDGSKPIWFTEFGWSTHTTAAGANNWDRGVTEAVQSTRLIQAAAVVDTSMPYVERMYWYCERNTSTGSPQYDNYGIYRTDFSAKPVLTGMRTVNTT